MTKIIKRFVSLFIILITILPLIFSCNWEKKYTIWVVTEQTTWDRMNGVLYSLQREFRKTHPDVEFKVDYLPTEKQERDVFLQQLRTDILQGGGPDCYLLPTDDNLILDVPTQYVYEEVEPLFPDVELAMRNGLFYDVSKLYDADETLKKDRLNKKIMDSGVVDGKRFVLPLRYDIPVIYAKNDHLERAGLDINVLNGDILSIMEAVYMTEAPYLAGGVLYDGLSVFSSLINYDSGKYTTDVETLKDFLGYYQKLKAVLGEAYVDYDKESPDAKSVVLAEKNRIFLEKLDLKKYIYCNYFSDIELAGSNYDRNAPKTEYYPLWIGSMQDMLEYVPMAQYEDSELTILPLRSLDGGITATVTYYGAVGSGSKEPELAYEFLTQFLTEESQWESNRPKRPYTTPIKGTSGNTSNDTHYPGLVESGWPVLDKDALQTLWNRRRKQLYVRDMERGKTSEQEWRMRQIGLMGELNADNIPIFDVTIDSVRYETALSSEFSSILNALNDTHNANLPTSADIEQLINDYIEKIRFHILEG